MNRYLAAGIVSAALCAWPLSAFSAGGTNLGGGGSGGEEVIDVAAVQAACKADPASCSIVLTDILGAAAQGETEPNDHAVSADALASSVPLRGQLYASEDEDWYYIQTFETNTNLTVIMNPDNTGVTPTWRTSVRDGQGNILASAISTNIEEVDYSYTTTVAQAGLYYIVVESAAAIGDDGIYSLTAVLESTGGGTGQPAFNFKDVEFEPNGSFTNPTTLVSDVTMKGQLMNGGDLDIYSIESPGNEILHISLCAEGTTCYIEDNSLRTWVIYGFNSNASDAMLDPITVTRADKSVAVVNDEDVPGIVEITSTHPYYLEEFGGFAPALIAVNDPTFGPSTELDIALSDAGTYYIGIAAVLKRQEDGSIINQEVKAGEPDHLFLIVEPFSDDNYSFRLTKTSLDPSTANSTTALLNQLRPTYNSTTGSLYIPELTVDGQVFNAQLLKAPEGNSFNLQSAAPVAIPLRAPD